MKTYSWVGYVDFQETDPHIFCGRIEVFDDNGGWAIAEHTVRYKQVFPNEMDFREWVDDLETEEILDTDAIFQLFLQKYSQMQFQQLIVYTNRYGRPILKVLNPISPREVVLKKSSQFDRRHLLK